MTDGSGGLYFGAASASLSGGTTGLVTRWTSPTTVGSGLFIDNGTVAGVNATSSSYTFNVQGTAATNPFNVASSTGASLFMIGSNGIITSGTSSTALTLASGKIDGDALTLASTSDVITGTSSGSGLAVYADGLSMLRGCSTGQVLRWNATTAAWECNKGTDAINVVKSTNQSTTTTTLMADNQLSFPVASGETWVYKFDLIATNYNSATPDWKAAIKGAAGWTCRAIQSGSEGAGAVFLQASSTNCTATPSAMVNGAVSADGVGGQGFNVTIQGWITSTSVGNVQLQWAASSIGLLTVLAGSRVTAQKVGGVDVAEMYYTKDESLAPGDVVSIDSSISAGVKKSSSSYDKNAIGIVSTKPGLVLGDGTANITDTPVMIALTGRVPVKVNNENGPIAAGDNLTPSSVPGVAMKATRAGQIIGQAMNDYNASGEGTVLAFIKTGVANGSSVEDLLSTEQATSTLETSVAKRTLIHFIARVESVVQNLNLSEIITDRLSAALEVITPKILTGEIATNKITSAVGSDVNVKLEDGGLFTIGSSATSSLTSTTFDALGNASFAGTVTTGNLTVTNNIFTQNDVLVGKKLSVEEDVYVQGGIFSLGDASIEGKLLIGTTSHEVLSVDTLNSKVSIGTTTGEATFLVQGTTGDDVFMVASSTGSTLFSVVSSGNVGIGTSSPVATLSVQGRDGVNPLVVTSSLGDSLFTVDQNGSVGVGTSDPLAKFDIWGSLRVGTGTLPTFTVNTATNIVGIGNDGTALDDEVLRVSGRVRATGFDIDSAADLAENFEATEAVDAGTVVAFSTSTVEWNVGKSTSTEENYTMSTVRKARVAPEAIGVVSTNPGIILGKRVKNGVPVAFSGRIPVKVTRENGDIKQGDYLTVSATVPGYAMKLVGEGHSIGRALSDYQESRDKVLMLVENSFQRLDLLGKNATTTGMLTVGNIDLNANGVAITNIKSLSSANGTWSIDENGRIVAKQLCLEDLCIDKNTLTNMLQVAGQSGSVLGVSTSTDQSTSTVPVLPEVSTSTVPTSTTTEVVPPVVTPEQATTTPTGTPDPVAISTEQLPPPAVTEVIVEAPVAPPVSVEVLPVVSETVVAPIESIVPVVE
jgi:hypothetical protein